jgi:hypothetical protein
MIIRKERVGRNTTMIKKEREMRTRKKRQEGAENNMKQEEGKINKMQEVDE